MGGAWPVASIQDHNSIYAYIVKAYIYVKLFDSLVLSMLFPFLFTISHLYYQE